MTQWIDMADPFVLAASDGRYYLYGTSRRLGEFDVFISEDLTHWRDGGCIYKAGPEDWGVSCFWAPECYEIGGKYYLFFSANCRDNPTHEEENFRIGCAVADAPAGPFRNLVNRPLFDPGFPIIDASIYREDGHTWLFGSRCCYKHKVGAYEESWIYGMELAEDFQSIKGEPRLLLQPEQAWEDRSVHVGRRWNEGSFLIKEGNTYYMTFSANFFEENDYAVGVATADSPMGPYTKYPGNPILEADGQVLGTGHSNLFRGFDGQLYIAYHGRTQAGGHTRLSFIGKASFREGRLTVEGAKEPLRY